MNANGSFVPGASRPDGKYVDELLIPQFCEIVEKYGVNGFWVDGECWKVSPDFRPDTIKKFEEETGIDLGGKIPATREDPYFEEYREYLSDYNYAYSRSELLTVIEKHADYLAAFSVLAYKSVCKA